MRVLESALGSLKPGWFAVLDFVAKPQGDAPYAQVALEPSGWYLEVVSDWYLPRHEWPIDELALRRAGWSPPVEVSDNWLRYDSAQLSLGDLAALLVDALIVGRCCDAAGEFRVTTGAFPSGPDGGEPVPLPWVAVAA